MGIAANDVFWAIDLSKRANYERVIRQLFEKKSCVGVFLYQEDGNFAEENRLCVSSYVCL